MRLIDADAIDLCCIGCLDADGKVCLREEDVRESIDRTPTIEAEPVRHGRWIICSDGYYPYCSECKKEPKSGDMTKHCPNCGAKMDGDSNEAQTLLW